jgi:hypothetical protein
MNDLVIKCFPSTKKKGVLKMRKTIVCTISMVFVVALGTAYSADDNAVTDFTGRSYDTFEMAPVAAVNSVEGTGAGGFRAGDNELFNGVSDFSGRSYDTFEMAPVAAVNSVEGSGAGGIRADDEELFNGVSDFSGRSYDTFEIVTAAAGNSVEGEGAGGLREGQEANKASHEGVGTTPSYDNFQMDW